MPSDIRADLHRQLAPYRGTFREVRWARPETWHLTLLFLGSVPPARVPELRRLVDHVARQVKPYAAVADQGGGRTGQRAGVAWLGLSEGSGALIEAATLATETCPPEITDGSPPKRTRSAHLTLVRKADQAVIEALRGQAHGPLRAAWTIDRLQLVRSHLASSGAHYETLYEATL